MRPFCSGHVTAGPPREEAHRFPLPIPMQSQFAGIRPSRRNALGFGISAVAKRRRRQSPMKDQIMSILSKLLKLLRPKEIPMAAVDYTDTNAEIAVLAGSILKLADVLAANTPAEVAQFRADLATAQADAAAKQADLDASQASEADIAAKFKAQNEALLALIPPAS